jgi:hypothetical protein
MKKFTPLLLILFLLAACGGGAEEETAVPQDERPALTVATPTAAPDLADLPPPVAQPEAAVEEPTAEPDDPAVLPPWSPDHFGYGAQSHAVVGDPAVTMHVLRDQLRLEWVKVQLEWPLLQPEPDVYNWFFYDGVVAEAQANGLYLMFSVVNSPPWTRADGITHGPPDDYNQFANFLRELLNRYPQQIHAIEVWNEQNLDREWLTPAGIVPEEYVEFLALSYETINSIDPDIIVISGALAPTGPGNWVSSAHDFEYMDRALAGGMLDYTDCVGVHHNGYNVPPDVRVEDTNSLAKAQTAYFRGPFDNLYSGDQLNHLWTFKSTMDGYIERVRQYDPDMPLCATEFGWATTEGYDVYPAGFGFAEDNSLEEQAEYIVQAFQIMRDSGDFWLAFLFNFDFGNKGGGPTDDPVPYSIVDTNGAPRPAFFAVANMEKRR